MSGLTFHTGALIALERSHARIRKVMVAALQSRLRVTVPAVVFAEWWRGSRQLRDLVRASVDIEPMDERLAESAGEALTAVKKSTTIDAIVMASAARRGDIVYTGDYEDLERLRGHFGAGPRILRV